MKTRLLSMFLGLLMISCGGNRNSNAEAETEAEPVEETDFFVFDLEKGIAEDPKFATLNELIDSIRYIPLETHKDALLNDEYCQIAKIGDDFFVNSMMGALSSPIYQFDSLGRFVKQITYIGRGPNEVNRFILGWWANANLGQINVVDLAKMVIVETESGGKSTVDFTPSQGFDRVPLNDSTFVSAQATNRKDTPTYLYFTDRNSNVVHAIERNDELLSYNWGGNGASEGKVPFPLEDYRLFSDYKGDAIFQDIFNDTLYRIKSHREITPHLVFKRGALSPRPNDLLKQQNKDRQVYFYVIRESGDHIFLSYVYDGKRFHDIWSKADGNLLMHAESEYPLLSPVYPLMLPDGSVIELQIVYADKDNIYGILRALDACKFLPGVKEDDNPVIVVAKLRK